MANIIFAPLLLILIALQSTSADAPAQIGPTGARLTTDDVAQITSIALAAGRPPWLVLGQSLSGPLRSPHPWPVAVFLIADYQSGALRRGRLLYVRAGLASIDDYAPPKKWELSSSSLWAQVPVDQGRPNQVRHSRDLSRPFAIAGVLDDRTIQDIVAFVRGADSKKTGVQAAWPIVWMSAGSDAKVTLHLLGPDEAELSGQVVVLAKSSTGWTIVSIAGWAV